MPSPTSHTPSHNPPSAQPRTIWLNYIDRIARPILSRSASGRLIREMPIEQKRPHRQNFAHLEAVGRLLCGMAPWLECAVDADNTMAPDEAKRCHELADLATKTLTQITDPAAPDALNFSQGQQPVVDAAFLAQAILRAPNLFCDSLDATTKAQVIKALRATRQCKPAFNNWLLFSAIIEAALDRLGEPWDEMRVDYAIRQHEQWYVGDGTYTDGPNFHWDYYNSLVIQPMLLDVLAQLQDRSQFQTEYLQQQYVVTTKRIQRHAVVLERMIGTDGTFPPLGRSLSYRCGAMHALAQVAWLRMLPDSLKPAQVRGALTAVISRTLQPDGTFDEQDFLRIGLCGAQPDMGENYISTGSLYLCSTAFLPLGLPATDPFWSEPDMPWTQLAAWSGIDIGLDHALAES